LKYEPKTETNPMMKQDNQTLSIGLLIAGLVISHPVAAKDKTVAAPLPKAPVIATIDTAAPSKAYSPMLFGGFIEHFQDQIYGGLFDPGSPLSDERGFRKDVIAAMKELKLSVIRWPGGCFVSGYHWKNGVGKVRKPVPDPVWGATEPNTFGTDEFIEWCRLVGCEPYICTNAGNGTPEEMRQWVEYCNGTKGEYADLRKANGHEQPYKVKYWSIGNENYGYWEIGRKTPETWGPLVHDCAGLMLSVDPDLKLAAASWLDKRDWNLPLLKAAGKDLTFMAVHSYFHNKESIIPFKECMKFSAGPEKVINGVIANIEEAGFRGKIKIAYDEWNLRHWYHPGFPRKSVVNADDAKAAEFIKKREDNAIASTYTMADALFTSAFLNACRRRGHGRHCADCEHKRSALRSPQGHRQAHHFSHPGHVRQRTRRARRSSQTRDGSTQRATGWHRHHGRDRQALGHRADQSRGLGNSRLRGQVG
jgi:alpha-N-arabinofuranosidase